MMKKSNRSKVANLQRKRERARLRRLDVVYDPDKIANRMAAAEHRDDHTIAL